MFRKNSAVATLMVLVGVGSMGLGLYSRELSDAGSNTAPRSLDSLWASRDDVLNQDVEIPENRYYQQISDLLHDEFVEPIKDDNKLANGAIRGMVASLGDTRSLFMDAEGFRAFQNAEKGEYEGIGADFRLDMPAGWNPDPKKSKGLGIPSLVVSGLVAGGPADKAGIKVGDQIDTVDGHWVVSPNLIEKFREVQAQVEAGKAGADSLRKLRTELRKKSEGSLLPLKARERLYMGTTGTVKLAVRRGVQLITATVTKGKSQDHAAAKEGEVIKVRFIQGVGKALAEMVPDSGSVILDFRGCGSHRLDLAMEALSALAPAGPVGTWDDARPETPSRKLETSSGSNKTTKYVLLVDESTAGAAAIAANALVSRKLATLSGTPSSDVTVTDTVSSVDGTGYTLVTGSVIGGKL